MGNRQFIGFRSNLIYATFAQFVSISSSAAMTLIVSKVLEAEDFSYWQLFIFYSTYVGLFHFGVTDGIYMRYGGYAKADLNNKLLGSQLKLLVIIQSIVGILLMLVFKSFCDDFNRILVIEFISVYLILANISYFLGYIFQAVNEISIHSKSIIITKGIFFISVGISVLNNVQDFSIFCLLFVISQLLGTIYIIIKGKEILLSELLPLRQVLREFVLNMSIGLYITFSSIASTLILGIGRFFIDSNYGIMTFGIISLALSMTNFILNFLSQISLVLFPILRRIEEEKIVGFFRCSSILLSLFLSLFLLIFPILKLFMENWLPQYNECISYMAILFPLCLFDGKMQMLYITYLKVLRCERFMLTINFCSMIFSFLACCFFTQTLNSAISIVYAMLMAIIFRSIITSIFLTKRLGIMYEHTIIVELVVVGIFIYTNLNYSVSVFVFVYFIFMLSYIMFKWNNIKNAVNWLKQIS